MSIARIERIVGGVIKGTAEPAKEDGKYHCHAFGSNVAPVPFSTLEEVATYLRINKGAGVRMNPGWGKISENIFVDGAPL
jgi:hypothetical protein